MWKLDLSSINFKIVKIFKERLFHKKKHDVRESAPANGLYFLGAKYKDIQNTNIPFKKFFDSLWVRLKYAELMI